MERYHIVYAVIIAALLFSCLSGCGFKEPILEVLDGNYRFLRGDYTGANISYLKAREKEVYKEWISYNIGNVYNALGETDLAIEELLFATTGEQSELLFRTHFNIGNIYFELGDYEKAVFHFRQSLEAKPNSIDAKINLEIAIDKMEKERALQTNRETQPEKRDVEMTAELIDILDQAKQKEAMVWKFLKKAEKEDTPEEDW
ncbi:MAG: tetratricopeptide repeat protein [Spirochaetales bacterium]|nr:tetratricopeptide repeat protein [Spirochaetales bacterium]